MVGNAEFLPPETRIGGTDKRVVDFWRWAYSDVGQNISRGPLAEFLVAAALGIEESTPPRDPWAGYDLELHLNGQPFRIEVKSTASIQAWKPRDPKKPRVVKGFSVRFAKIEYSLDGGKREARGSHVYVLAFDKVPDEDHLRILDVTRWQFWVLSRDDLEEFLASSIEKLRGHSKSISFIRLNQAGFLPVGFDAVGASVRDKCTRRG